MDPRHKKRIKIVQQLFSEEFYPQKSLLPKTKKILEHKNRITNIIKKFASKFPIETIAKVDLSILTLSIYELIIEKKHPQKVIIDEAVELAKELGGEKSYAFINGVLGKIVSNLEKI